MQKYCTVYWCLFKDTFLDTVVLFFWYIVTIVYVKMGS